MLSAFFGLITSIPGLVTGLLGYLNKRTDAEVSKLGISKEMAIETLKNDAIVKQATANVIIAAMNHRVWWIAWIVFVLPVGIYEASIFFVSTFDVFLNTAHCTTACEWYVKRVPEEQEKVAMLIMQSIFLAQAGTGAVAGVVHAITARLSK